MTVKYNNVPIQDIAFLLEAEGVWTERSYTYTYYNHLVNGTPIVRAGIMKEIKGLYNVDILPEGALGACCTVIIHGAESNVIPSPPSSGLKSIW